MPSLLKAHSDKLLSCAIPAEHHNDLAMTSVGEGVLQIAYLEPNGESTLTHDGRPFIRERLSDAERDHRWQQRQRDNKNAKRPGKYSSPGGNGCRLYHSPLRVQQSSYREKLYDINTELRFTEGEFKTIAANIHDPKCITIGLGGVSSWRDRYDGQSKDESSQPIIELQELNLSGRRVRLCFDSDHHKPQVRSALKQFAEYLDERGAVVIIEVLPSMPQRDRNGEWIRLGLDDLIHHYGADAFLAIKSIAQPAFQTKGKNIVYAPEFEPKNSHRRNIYLKILAGKNWRASKESDKAWIQWTGTHWLPVTSSDPIYRIVEQVMDCNGWEDREQRTVNSLVAAFRRSIELDPPLEVKGLIPCLNGCLRLSDHKLIPHDPEHGNTSCLPFDFNPLAAHEPITNVLSEMITPTEMEMFRAGAQSIATGRARKAFLEITGPGNSGKSVFGRLLTALAGFDNTVSCDLEKMEDRKNRFETIRLRGKRLAVFNECDRYSGPMGVLKAMTGGDVIRGELKKSNSQLDFFFTGFTVLIGNGSVRPSDTSGAVINRRRSISVPNVIATDSERELLEPDGDSWRGEFVDHLPGFLNWALAMSHKEANVALGKDSNDLSRIQRDLDTLFQTDPLAAWAEDYLIFDPDCKFTQVGNNKTFYLEAGKPRIEWERLLLPHYQARAEFKSGRGAYGKDNFKEKLVGHLRDTFGLPLPMGPLNRGAYKNRKVGSVIPLVRFRTKADGDRAGIITQAAMLKLNGNRDGQAVSDQFDGADQIPVRDECDGCDGFLDIEKKKNKKDSSVFPIGVNQKNGGNRLASHRKGSGHLAAVSPASGRHASVTPSLNGDADTFWQIVADNPDCLAIQIANKFHAATGRNFSGAQVKALMDQSRPSVAAGPAAEFDFDRDF